VTAPESRLPGAMIAPALKAALGDWQQRVVVLAGIDAVTTELIRLRAASHHQCHT
jgi:hypothetical protein